LSAEGVEEGATEQAAVTPATGKSFGLRKPEGEPETAKKYLTSEDVPKIAEELLSRLLGGLKEQMAQAQPPKEQAPTATPEPKPEPIPATKPAISEPKPAPAAKPAAPEPKPEPIPTTKPAISEPKPAPAAKPSAPEPAPAEKPAPVKTIPPAAEKPASPQPALSTVPQPAEGGEPAKPAEPTPTEAATQPQPAAGMEDLKTVLATGIATLSATLERLITVVENSQKETQQMMAQLADGIKTEMVKSDADEDDYERYT
jgi:hypothetical protein